MHAQIDALEAVPGGRTIFRRRHLKADGRELFLYGCAPPAGDPIGAELAASPDAACEIRRHPLRGDQAIYAAGRQARTFMPAAADDPLAPATTGGAPTEIPFPDFEIAVFENRFPSLSAGAPLAPSGPAGVARTPARGRCEVVVYGPQAEGSLATLPPERRELLVSVWADRYRALFERGFAYVLPFENRGVEVGVTLPHPHGQIYAFGETPEPQRRAAEAFAAGFDLAARIEDWRRDYEIARAGGVVAFAPPFARFPYEAWIAPAARRAGPWAFDAGEVEAFAHLLGDMTRRYDAVFGRCTPYMLTLHAAPAGDAPDYHFTAQFYPLLRAPDRLKYLAAVEQATGVFTVDVLPERAAAELRAR
jgi:UDPglucose--hexose-1-phosphate uridylyltransferase